MRRELLILAVVAVIAWNGLQRLDYHVNPWLDPVVTEEELDASLWIKENTSTDALFGCDIFGCELLMGAAARKGIIGGDWAGNPDAVENMLAYQKLVLTGNSTEAHAIAVRNGLDYIVVPNRMVFTGFEWESMSSEKFSEHEYFEESYSNGEVTVYRVKG